MEVAECFHENPRRHGNPHFPVEKQGKAADPFVVEDLLDFSHEEDGSFGGRGAEVGFDQVPVNSTGDSAHTVVDRCSLSSSSVCGMHLPADAGGCSFGGAALSNDLCVPQEEVAELEWLSSFVEESFSSEDLQNFQLISGVKLKPSCSPSSSSATEALPSQATAAFYPETHVRGKARSKRPRPPPPSNNWSSRVLALNPAAVSSEFHDSTANASKPAKKKGGDSSGQEPSGRRCLHCATDTTPQWRAGPMGPKSLCNACGVRYKSGRLVPEYRPVASPTFVPSKHSNSHRKVLELRRQKEQQRQQQQQRREEEENSCQFVVPSGFLPGTCWLDEQF